MTSPSINWNLREGQIRLADNDTDQYAIWLFNNLNKQNIKQLKSTTKLFLRMNNSWLQPELAPVFGEIVQNRKSDLIKAVEKGECAAKGIPALSRQSQYAVIGAAMCELLERRILDDSLIRG